MLNSTDRFGVRFVLIGKEDCFITKFFLLVYLVLLFCFNQLGGILSKFWSKLQIPHVIYLDDIMTGHNDHSTASNFQNSILTSLFNAGLVVSVPKLT